jgi:FAD/FMN-containing dehydrogenase
MGPILNEPRKRFHVPARAVVRPRTCAQVQALVAAGPMRGVALIPQGGNTGLVGAQVPLRGDEVIVSLQRLDRVREVNAEAGNMTWQRRG